MLSNSFLFQWLSFIFRLYFLTLLTGSILVCAYDPDFHIKFHVIGALRSSTRRSTRRSTSYMRSGCYVWTPNVWKPNILSGLLTQLPSFQTPVHLGLNFGQARVFSVSLHVVCMNRTFCTHMTWHLVRGIYQSLLISFSVL